jgi:hypothetical protein
MSNLDNSLRGEQYAMKTEQMPNANRTSTEQTPNKVLAGNSKPKA